ncbi:MAG: restriction endonuclease subunit S [Candidatus Electrothrix sp. AR5]|nr:restriction endonuclease subunit S [Candidatus Electrothrix sp. AR5]
MKVKEQNVPVLRFPGFDGEWEQKRLKNLTKINQGLQIAISERYTSPIDGGYFYITNEFLRKNSRTAYYIKNPPESVICNKNDILMTRTGNTGQVVTGVEGAFHNNFFKILYKEECDRWFLYYFLTSHKTQHTILKLAGTSTIPDLNHGDFYKISISIPFPKEQKKIASFLAAVDSKIEQLSKKKALLEQYKKGMMQKLFSQELRFKDEQGNEFPDWEERKAGTIFHNHTNKKHNSDLPILAATQDRGVIPRNETGLDIKSSKRSIASYKIIEPGDFVISLRSFQGGIEFSEYLGICSPAYIVLKPSIEITDEYFKFYFKKEDFISRLNNTVIGIRDGKQIPYSSFAAMKLNIPCLSEQQKIANFLSSIDKKINLISTELTQAQTFKKSLLQQMFV